MLYRAFLILFLGLLCLGWILITALPQNQLEEDVNQAMTYIKAKEYAAALPLLEPHIPVLLDSLQNQPSALKAMTAILMACYSKTGHIEKAREWQNKLLEVALAIQDFPLLNQQINKLYQQGRYTESIRWAEKAVEIIGKLNPNHLDYGNSLNNLAVSHLAMGHYNRAESLFLQTKNIFKAQLGEDHPHYAQLLNNLASLYKSMGRYGESAPLYQQAMSIQKRQLGEDHPSYATSLNNLALLYQDMGRYAEAAPLYQQAMSSLKRQLGEDHPSYANLLNNLAGLYESMGRHPEAEPFYQKASQIYKEQLGEEHPSYATSLNNLAALYESMGRYGESEPLYRETMQIYKMQLGEDHPSYANSLNNLAYLYQDMGHFEKAETFYLQALQIREEQLGKDSPLYANSLNNLANLYQVIGRYDEAELLNEQALEIRKEHLGEGHPDYATSLGSIAILYESMGRYGKAEPLFLKALKINEEQLGENHPRYADLLNNLAALYESVGRYTEAESFYLQAIKIIKEQLGESHPKYAGLLNNLAHLYESISRYAEAVSLNLHALQIKKDQLGEDHPDYATSLGNLATSYMAMGYYDKVEPLLLQAMNIYKVQLGEKHPLYAQLLNNLAILHETMGRYAEALGLHLQALQIRKEQLGEAHPHYATSLNSLAQLFLNMGYYDKAEPLYLQTLKINEEQLGEDHPDYAQSLNNLAVSYEFMDQYEKAEPLYLRALKVSEEQLGTDHPHYASSLNNLAGLYLDMGRYTEAEQLFQQAMKIRKDQLGEDHPTYATSLDNLSVLYQAMGHYEKAEPLLLISNDILKKTLQTGFIGLSEKEKQKYLQTALNNFWFYHSFVLRRMAANPAVVSMSYNNSLIVKGLLLRSSQDIQLAIAKSQDSTLLDTYDTWLDCKRQLAYLYTKPISQRYADTDSIEKLTNNLEKTLNRQASAFQEQTEALQVQWPEVRQELKKGEAAVEFIHFRYCNNAALTDTTYYAALVLRPQDEYPHMVKLGTQSQLDGLLSDTSSTQLAQRLYSSRGVINANQSVSQGQALYELIWQPLDSLLSDVETVYFSPSGRLHQVAFAALPYGKDSLQMARYRLHQLSSTRLLALDDTEDDTSNISATLFGGIHYDTDTTELLAMASNRGFRSTTSTYVPEEALRSQKLDYLPGSASEVRFIAEQLEQQGIPTELYTGSEALEEQFKQLGKGSPSPTILHIATHGFFFPDVKDTLRDQLMASLNEQQQVYRITDDPLRRAGLLMAGANHAWLGEKIPEGLDDGILTAYEVSQMNLSNTELVVLSACETGLGQIQGSEGVYGLQRAFKMAGAKNLIMSLWQVPDQETQEMMQLFYRFYLQEKLSIRQAFRNAQQQMREKYDPYYWAAFTLVE
ncbi:MAG: tetratricopeptide repeat protein [Cyclobacteriaceae bacterium]